MLGRYSLAVKKPLILAGKLICFFGCFLWNLFGIILLLSLMGLIIFATCKVDWEFIGWFIMLPFVFWQFPWVHCQFSRPEEADL